MFEFAWFSCLASLSLVMFTARTGHAAGSTGGHMTTTQPVEVHLACGDTVTTQAVPRLGVYRFCIHCDSRKKVVAIASQPTTIRKDQS
jgi:hypothetical protein